MVSFVVKPGTGGAIKTPQTDIEPGKTQQSGVSMEIEVYPVGDQGAMSTISIQQSEKMRGI